SPRLELDGGLLAFSVPQGDRRAEPDVLFVYDVDRGLAQVVHDAGHPQFFVTRMGFGPVNNAFLPSLPLDFSVRSGRVAFVVDESEQGEDLGGDGQADGFALLLVERDGTVVNLH